MQISMAREQGETMTSKEFIRNLNSVDGGLVLPENLSRQETEAGMGEGQVLGRTEDFFLV